MIEKPNRKTVRISHPHITKIMKRKYINNSKLLKALENQNLTLTTETYKRKEENWQEKTYSGRLVKDPKGNYLFKNKTTILNITNFAVMSKCYETFAINLSKIA